jgi:hypothetical protein
MTWREAQLTLQLMAEERIGAPRRAVAAQQGDAQDAASAALHKALT